MTHTLVSTEQKNHKQNNTAKYDYYLYFGEFGKEWKQLIWQQATSNKWLGLAFTVI